MEQERVREREPEVSGENYERTLRQRAEWVERTMKGKVVIKGAGLPWEVNRQSRVRHYLNPLYFTDTALSNWVIFIHDIQRQSGRHRHQGGLVIYVVEGEGTTDVEGMRVDWKAGDLLLLPIKPKGVTHQHFNKDAEKGCRWMAFIYEPFSQYLMDEIVQVENRPLDQGVGSTAAAVQRLKSAGARIGHYSSERSDYQPRRIRNPQELAGANLLDELYKLRDHQRFIGERATWMIRGDDLPWETNAQGIMRWYLHPAIEYACLQTLLFYIQRIPAGSRSGRQRHGGDAVFFVLEGRGHTILDGVTHHWETGDLIGLPNRPGGIIYQHFNDDAEQPVTLVACEPNLIHTVGLDRGAGLEQLESCPEYGQAKSLAAAH